MGAAGRSDAEEAILRGLGPHTRDHARLLLRAVPDLRVTSGLRSPDSNRRAGGSPRSYHLKGRAVDFVADRETLRTAASVARSQRVGLRCTGPEEILIHDVGSGVHLHVAW